MKYIKNILNDKIIEKILFLLLGFLFFPTIVATILFYFKISISSITFYIGLLILLILYFVIFYKKNTSLKEIIMPLLFSIIIIALFIIISICFKENTFDGWSYHMPAVMHLKDGWNPIFEHNEDIGLWSAHYPKFIWIYGSLLYSVTGSIFSGTSFNSIIAFSMFFLIYDILNRKGNNKLFVLLISLALTFNVVVLGQLLSYYNDGTLGVCIMALLLIFYAISKNIYKLENNYLLVFFISVYASILANIKFNGSLYSFLIIILIGGYLLIKKNLHFNKFFVKSCLMIGIAVIPIAILTYVPNYIYHKNIGYPIVGKNKVDIITKAMAKRYENKGKLTSFAMVIFSNPPKEEFEFYPFWKSDKAAITSTIRADSGRYGFGPGYQIIVILSILLLIFSIIKNIKRMKIKNIKNYSSEIMIILMLLLIFYITPATWWYRYVPYMYSLPILLLIFFKDDWNIKTVTTKISLLLLVVYIGIGVFSICGKLYGQSHYVREFNQNIKEFKEISKNEDLMFNDYNKDINYYKEKIRNKLFDDYDINYKVINDEKCEVIKNYNIFGISRVTCNVNKEEK